MRLPALAAAGLLLLPRSAAGAELQPRDHYVTTMTVLGAAGGAALGAALGGLSRPEESSHMRPYMQWGSVGLVFGALLGRDIGLASLAQPADLPGPRPISTADANACLGALAGQLAGWGIVAAGGETDRDSRAPWAAVALGTLVGAGIGYLLPPVPLFTLPPERSEQESVHLKDVSRMEPLLPPDEVAGRPPSKAPPVQSMGSPLIPASRLRTLDRTLRDADSRKDLPPAVLVPAPGLPAPLAPGTPVGADLSAGSEAAPPHLWALDWALIGGAAAGALAGPDDEFWLRAALGASAGLLGGWSFAVVFTSPATGNSESALAGRKRALALGGAVGLAGGVAGIGAGAATRNYTEDFGLRKAALFTLGGGLVGTLTGSVIGLSGQDRGGVE